MKVLIQGLGEVPTTAEFALEKEKPDVTNVICSKFQMNHVASEVGYTQPNKAVIERATKRAKSKLVWKICDNFDVKSLERCIGEIFKGIKRTDEVVINYTGGAASVRLLLGLSGIILSKKYKVKLVYAVRYKAGTEVYLDQTADLKEIFSRLKKL